MKNIRDFLSENFHFLVVKLSAYLNGHVFMEKLEKHHFMVGKKCLTKMPHPELQPRVSTCL